MLRELAPGCAGFVVWGPKPCTAGYMVATWSLETTKPSG